MEKINLQLTENQLATINEALDTHAKTFPGPALRDKRNAIYAIQRVLVLQTKRDKAGMMLKDGKGVVARE